MTDPSWNEPSASAPSDTDDGTLDRLLTEARERIDALFAEPGRVMLFFSGGKDSLACLHLARRHWSRLILGWGDTGYMLPHMQAYVQSFAARVQVMVCRSDLKAYWDAIGLPSLTVQVNHEAESEGYPMQSWMRCCTQLRFQPVWRAVTAHADICAVMMGMRRDDRNAGATQQPHGGGYKVLMPVWDWSTAQVMAYLKREGAILPEQYAHGHSGSLECWVCPVFLRGSRARYLSERYPDLVAQAARAAGVAYRQSEAKIIAWRQDIASFLDDGPTRSGQP